MPVVTLRLFKVILLLACVLIVGAPLDSGGAYAQTPAASARRPLIFIPGLLGSRLCRDNPSKPAEPQVVWGSVSALPDFPTLRITEGGPDDVKPCGLIREIVFLGVVVQDVYGPAIAHLEKIGYRNGVDLFIFDYDWRRSVFDNAARLEGFVREKIPNPSQRFDIVAHSMGGLIARVFAQRHDNASQLARLFSAGTPFQGSAKVYVMVEKGWGTLNPLMGGLPAFRRTMLSFPSAYELVARYNDCCDAGAGRAFALGDSEAWRALKWDGVDPSTMTDLKKASGRAAELRTIVETPLPAGVEDVRLIGVDQRTPQRVAFETSGEGAIARLHTTWAGDATVLRDSAALGTAIVHPTSYSTHEKILNDPQIQEFLTVALTRDVAEAVRSVKVRPRGQIKTPDGKTTELIGLVLEPDETVYTTGQSGRVLVHFRLGNTQKLRADQIKMTSRTPDGQEVAIPLTADPKASQPGNVFEQSFSGQFVAGPTPGIVTLRVVVPLAGGSRRVEQPVAVIAK